MLRMNMAAALSAVVASYALCVSGASAVSAKEAAPVLAVVGAQQTFHDSGTECNGTTVHIDSPPRAFIDESGTVHLVVAGPNAAAYQWTGSPADFASNPSTATLSCTPVMRGAAGDNDPSHFNQRTFAQSLYYKTPTVYAYSHEDYFGTRLNKPGCHHAGSSDGLPYCWYSSIAVWTSTVASGDSALDFSPAEDVPSHVAIYPQVQYPGDEQTPTSGWIGPGTPSNIVAGRDQDGRPDGSYYLLAYYSSSYGGQMHGTCLFRSLDPSNIHSWRAWNGDADDPLFVREFGNPYEGTNHPCATVNAPTFDGGVRTVVWHPASRHYIAILSAGNGSVSYATSRDLLTWSKARVLRGVTISAYPSVIDWDAVNTPGSNFDAVIGQGSTYLYYRTSVASGHTQINRVPLDVTNY